MASPLACSARKRASPLGRRAPRAPSRGTTPRTHPGSKHTSVPAKSGAPKSEHSAHEVRRRADRAMLRDSWPAPLCTLIILLAPPLSPLHAGCHLAKTCAQHTAFVCHQFWVSRERVENALGADVQRSGMCSDFHPHHGCCDGDCARMRTSSSHSPGATPQHALPLGPLLTRCEDRVPNGLSDGWHERVLPGTPAFWRWRIAT